MLKRLLRKALDSLFVQVTLALLSLVLFSAGLSKGLSIMNEPSWLSIALGGFISLVSIAQLFIFCEPLYNRIKGG